MTFNVLLYGAYGYNGELIAEKAKKRFTAGRVILAGRSAGPLKKLADRLKLGYRAFGLEEPSTVARNLVDVQLVVNAAGPFVLTGPALVKGCLEAGCSYVDINGEVDVYMKLDDFARQASARKIALVCSAGHMAGSSNVLLHHALKALDKNPRIPVDKEGKRRLGAVRIALSMLPEASRGSATTGLRLMREQVLTIRRGERVNRDGDRVPGLVKWHEPVGRIERVFDFGGLERGERRPRGPRLMASAANVPDTLVAAKLLEDGKWDPERVESYVQMDALMRAGYQAGAAMAPFMAVPIIRTEAKLIAQLATPERPNSRPRDEQKQVSVLEIEGFDREILYKRRMRVPSGYDFSATLAVVLMERFAALSVEPEGKRPKPGWLTPTQVLYHGVDKIEELEQYFEDVD